MKHISIIPIILIIFLFIFTACEQEVITLTDEEKALASDLSEADLFRDIVKDSAQLKTVQDLLRDVKTRQGELLSKSVDFSQSTVNYFSIENFRFDVFKISEDDTPLTIEDYGPQGELPIEMRKPTIYVVFSQPVVPISKLGEPLRESPLMQIQPRAEGTFRFYGTRLLSFEPDQPLLKQREYTVTVSANTKSLGGKTLDIAFSFTFQTEYIDIVTFRPGDEDNFWADNSNVPPDIAQKVLIGFNQPVNMNFMKDYLKVTCAGREYAFSIARPQSKERELVENYINRTVVLTLREQLPKNNEVTVTMLPGACSDKGYAPRPTAVIKTYHTLLPFKYETYRSYSYAFPRDPKGTVNPVYLIFNQTVSEEDIDQYITTSFGTLSSWQQYIKVWQNEIRLNNLPVQYESIFYVYLDKDLKDIYGQRLGQNKKVGVEVGPAASYAVFPGGRVYNDDDWCYRMLEAQFNPLLIYEFQNMKSGKWRIASCQSGYAPDNNLPFETFDFSPYERNIAHYRLLDLTPWLDQNGRGAVQVSWDFTGEKQKGYYRYDYLQNLLVQVTDIGLTVRYAYNKILVWANSLSTGTPLEQAAVNLYSGNNKRRTSSTDQQGLAVFNLEAGEYTNYYANRDGPYFRLLVETENDRAEFIPAGTHYAGHFGVNSRSPYYAENAYYRTFFFTDRGLYKPGETVTFRGVDWDQVLGEFTPYQGSYKIVVRERKYRSKALLEQQANTTASGGFFGQFSLPADVEPGYYELAYSRPGWSYPRRETFQVAFFRRLNFQVSLKVPQRTFFQGEKLGFSANASYLAGGVMPNAAYSYYWTRRPRYFHPADEHYKKWVFGPSLRGGTDSLSSGTGQLSANGTALIEQATTGDENKGQAASYTLEITVEDIDRQEISTRASALVHPAAFYIGAKLSSPSADGWWSRFVEANKSLTAEINLVTPDSELYKQTTKVKAELIRRSWKSVQQQGVYGRITTRYTMVNEVVETKELTVNQGQASVSFTPDKAGSYIIKFSAQDGHNRDAVTELYFYASGASWVKFASSGDGDINLIVDQDLYFPGDKAQILMQSPLPEGKYLLTIEREGIIEQKIIELQGSASLIEIPIKEEYVPVVYVALCSCSERKEKPESYFQPDLGKPKGYFGVTGINVSTQSRELDVQIIPDKPVYRPGRQVTATVKVTQRGKPVAGAEVTFLAVDRGVLDIINYHVPDPVAFFYNQYNFPLFVTGDDSRRLLLDPVTYDIADLQGGGGGSKLERREDFTPLAVFKPYLVTDGKGQVEVTFTMPDTLTTYRSTALAFNGSKMGYQEQEILVQNPINVRTALPRRMRHRDSAIAGCIIQNIDEEEHEVTVKIQADGITMAGTTEKKIKVAAGESREVPFLLQADRVGTAEIVFTIISEVLSEELAAKLQIERPLVKEAFSTIGQADQIEEEDKTDELFAEEGLIIPSAIAEGFGGITLQLDSTQVPFLHEPLRQLYYYIPGGWLISYGYNALPGILYSEYLEDLLGISEEAARRRVEIYFETAERFQVEDGGIKAYNSSYFSSAYTSLQVAHYLLLAEARGMSLKSKPNRGELFAYIKSLYNNSDNSIYLRSYALYLLTLYNHNTRTDVESMVQQGDELGISGYALMALCYLELNDQGRAGDLYRRMKNFILLGTRSIDIVETYEARHYFDSGLTQMALMLKVAVAMNERAEQIQRITNTINRGRSSRHWRSCSDYCWTVIALYDIFKKEQKSQTDYRATVLLNNEDLLAEDFKGLSLKPKTFTFPFVQSPLAEIKRDELFPLRFIKQGRGSLFYTSTIEYALPSEVVLPRDEGISVFAQIEELDGKCVNSSRLELGKTYRYRVILSTSKRRSFVSLGVPVPSGAEIIDPSFDTSGQYLNSGGVREESWTRETFYGDEYRFDGEGYIYGGPMGWWWYYYTPNITIYDLEVRYEWEDVYSGQREVSFLFRTTTPGIYPTPPIMATLLFEPEVFGRTGGRLFVIE